ncbi:Flagellar basal-body rod protein FlgF [Buchnera aphidicola (Protaphis terricola)]|uniref:flagellar basal-body rod protein FlgF n=1 Tax=Buchnera aphidicola TaxID=9 RepID=UPI0034648031
MENSIYQSMQAAIQLLENQNVIANNLSNISTTGFKETFNLIIKDKNLKKVKIKQYYNFEPGLLINTQRKLDFIIKNDGWLAIYDHNGDEAYTKNGHLKINEKGELTVQNYKIISNQSDIKVSNKDNIKISPNGVIKVIKNQSNKISEVEIGSIKLVRFPKKDFIKKNGLFYLKNNKKFLKNKIIQTYKNDVCIEPEMLEISNVNASKNMVDMISNARQFEMNMKMISIEDQNIERANQLFNINNN